MLDKSKHGLCGFAMETAMKDVMMAIVMAAGLVACAQPTAPPAPDAPAPAAALADKDYTLERKPTPGDPASVLAFDDKLVLSVFGDDGSISQAEILLNPGAAPPPGMVAALGLAGAWTLHPVSIGKLGAGDRNGLCREGAPNFVLKQTDSEGAITLVGFRGLTATETDPALRCEAFRFRP